MREYIREQNDYNPIPFDLVSNQDHFTPTLLASVNPYAVSIRGETFFRGTGVIQEIGGGTYQLFPGKGDLSTGPVVIVLPAPGITTDYDPIRFRINCVPAYEVVPYIQDRLCLLPFLMVLSSDHMSPALNKFPVVSLSRNGAAFEALNSGNSFISEIGLGFYGARIQSFAEHPPDDHNNECVYQIIATAPDADTSYDSFHVFRYNYPA